MEYMKFSKCTFNVCFSVSIVLVMFVLVSYANPLVHFQGILELNGQLAPDSTYSFTYKIYPSETGFPEVWAESHSLETENAIYNVYLGGTSPIGDLDFSQNTYWLEIVVNGETMGSRQKIAYSMASIWAEKADSAHFADSSEVAGRMPLESITADMIVPDIVSSINSLTNDGGNIELVGGDNVTVSVIRDSIEISSDGGGVSDHGFLSGLEDDDHQQYLLANGDRILTGSLNMGGNHIDSTGSIEPRSANVCNIGSSSKYYNSGHFNGIRMHTVYGEISAYNDGNKIRLYDVEDIEAEEDNVGEIGTSTYRFADLYCVQIHSPVIVEHIEIVSHVQEFDVVVWQDGQLESCNTPEDKKVFGVASFEEDYTKDEGEKNFLGTGKYYSVIQGIFQIRVTGKVEEGDLLVTSSVPGCAMAVESPSPFTVIGQALESSLGGQSVIKAMIRKM